MIRDAAKAAVEKAHRTLNSRIQAPYRLELMVAKPVLADLFCLLPSVERLDAITVGYTAQSMREITSLLGAFSYLATTQN